MEIKKDEPKAIALPSNSGRQCDICFALESQMKKGSKFYCYEEGFTLQEDKFICEDCANGLKHIRKICHQKAEKPSMKIFENFMPWFTKEVPGLEEVFKKD